MEKTCGKNAAEWQYKTHRAMIQPTMDFADCDLGMIIFYWISNVVTGNFKLESEFSNKQWSDWKILDFSDGGVNPGHGASISRQTAGEYPPTHTHTPGHKFAKGGY